MSNYPPGVTGSEPHITGIWPCRVCGGMGYDADEDGKHPCGWCTGSGEEPEDPEVDQVRALNDYSNKEAREFVFRCATEWLDIHDSDTIRKHVRDMIEIVRYKRKPATDSEINRSFDAYR